MRSIWKGSIAFGLVNVPVKVYTATEDHDIKFHQVHAADGGGSAMSGSAPWMGSRFSMPISTRPTSRPMVIG